MKNGTIVEIMGLKWTVLDQMEKGVFCICEDTGDEVLDQDTNNWAKSELRKKLNTKFLKKLEKAVGPENIIPFERDLTSLDGLKDYGTCEDKVSIISFDEGRKYREFLPSTGRWWWTLTSWSTPVTGIKYLMAVFSPRGCIININCDNYIGVRPVCIFSPSIFESGKVKVIE